MLVNAKEEIVKTRTEILLKDYDCCKCEKCVEDMMALALNNLAPAYVSTHKGELFKRIDSTILQNSTDIDIEVIKAIETVSAKPMH
ncbi:MAG: late competence development ComFB family protein [Oscillospiraceae bacterium]|nr:late competence development ComFB family protein [Oscillospiraceae bacterium]